MPEIKCSYLNDDLDCVDALKLIAFKDKGDFGFYTITIKKVYPETEDEECTLNHLDKKRECNTFTIYDNPKKDYTDREVIYTPVSLYYPHEDKYYLGQLKLEAYR